MGRVSPQNGQTERPEWAHLLAAWLADFLLYMQGSHCQYLTKVEKTSAQGAQK